MSGTRIVGTAALELQKKKKNMHFVLCTLGQGYAMIIENLKVFLKKLTLN